MKLLAHEEFQLNAVDRRFRVAAIRGFVCKLLGTTSGDPASPRRKCSIAELDPFALSAERDTRFRTVIPTSVYKNGGEQPRRRPLGRTNHI